MPLYYSRDYVYDQLPLRGLTSWSSCVVFSRVFASFLYGVTGQLQNLIVSIPDLCLPLYFGCHFALDLKLNT